MKLAAFALALLLLSGCAHVVIPLAIGFAGTVAGNLTSDGIEGKWGK